MDLDEARDQAAAAEGATEPESAAPDPTAAEPTVGTGSVFAIGCALLTLMVIFVGIAIFFML